MSDDFVLDLSDPSDDPTITITSAYIDSVPVRKCADERRRAWATFLYVMAAGFPMSKAEIAKIDDLTRFLQGGFAGPRDTDTS